MGLLLKLSSNNLAKTGVFRNNVTIQNITNTYLSVIDFINTTTNYFDKNINTVFGDLNKKNIIEGVVIGEANAVIPLYINKYHWIIAKKYLEPILGIIISHNPFNFTDGYKSLFYSIFSDMTRRLFSSNKENLSHNFIKTYMAYFRTCAEICFENKYNHGIKKLVSMYLSDPLKRISKDNYVYDKICSQMLCTGYILDDANMKILILYIIEELIRINICDYDELYIDYVLKLDKKEIDNEITNMINVINKKISVGLESLVSFYKMNKIIDEIIKTNVTYGQFIRQIDENYGLISNDMSNKIFKMIENNTNYEITNLEELYTSIGIKYNKYNIMAYIFQGIKHCKNKNRIDAINNNKCINIQKIDFNYDMLVESF